tara:strand:- start:690 stop:1607 length:918 start_codon:yes stop_codon:yes gene_type:complete
LLNKLILIAGPTASGKSKLAVKLAGKINGEVINADSMQVYKDFSILTSRPNRKEKKNIKHHLYGIISAKKEFSVGSWIKLVKKKVKDLQKRGKIPIIVGGTGLYFNAVVKGISKIPHINKNFRNNIRLLQKKLGQRDFYKRLIKIDPKCKEKIFMSDTQRTIRAYEVKMYTKKSIFDWAAHTKSDFLHCDIRKIFLQIPREDLLKRIDTRTGKMLDGGSINEVKKFVKLHIDKTLSANKIIGIKEIRDYFSGTITLEEARNAINIKTRQYAKRQNTWSRGHMVSWHKLYSKDLSILLKKVLKVIS